MPWARVSRKLFRDLGAGEPDRNFGDFSTALERGAPPLTIDTYHRTWPPVQCISDFIRLWPPLLKRSPMSDSTIFLRQYATVYCVYPPSILVYSPRVFFCISAYPSRICRVFARISSAYPAYYFRKSRVFAAYSPHILTYPAYSCVFAVYPSAYSRIFIRVSLLFALATWSGEKQRKALAATGEQTIPKERNTGGHTERPTTKYGPDLLMSKTVPCCAPRA